MSNVVALKLERANAEQIAALIERAREASRRAYCPYSGFPVGVALLTSTDEIYSGCNVENASYGLTMCAERNTVFHAVAEGMVALKTLVIYTPTDTPTAPCGACRQVLNEFGPDAQVLCVCEGPERIDRPVSKLLPEAFGPKNLPK